MDKRWEKLFTLRGKTSLTIIKDELKKQNFIKNFKIINVVGTNGKGSVTNMIAKGLQDSGKKVGIFTSPHINKPNERIRVNNSFITDKDFFDIYDSVDCRHFFSLLFIVAMKYFQNKKIDIAIIEAGVGGLKDSTNSVDGDYGILTSIGLDHIDYLGNTHQKIFDDKIGIKNDGMNFFVPSVLPNDIKYRNIESINNSGKTYQERNLKLSRGFLNKNFNIELAKSVPLKGRSEIKYINGHRCILDVAHNKDGIKASLEYLKNKEIEFDEVVLSLAKRKKIDGILELFTKKIIRFYKPDETFRDFNFEKIENIKCYKPNARTLYIGSFRLVSELYEN